MGEFIRIILVVGFFAALLEYSQEWATAIIDSFREAGAHASGRSKPLFPGDLFEEAVSLADVVLNARSWGLFTAVTKSLAAMIVLLCFAFIAAFMAFTLVESYIIINASVIFMGFGASQWTRELTITAFRYSLSVGAKLFVLTLIVTLITDSAVTWRKAYDGASASMWTLIGLSFVCAYLAKTIPDTIAGLISGTSSGGGGSIGSMASASVGAAVALGAAAATGGASTGVTGTMGAAGGAGGGMGSAMGGMGAAGGAGGGMGSAMEGMRSNNINASRMTGNPFKGGNKPQYYSENPRTAGGVSPSTRTNQAKPQSTGGTSKGEAVNIGLKTVGTLAAISVPGMEDATNLNLNTPPPSLEDTLLQDAHEYYNSQSNETEVVDNTANTISAGPGKKDE
ncbi:P-type conjugative transfer protein TrbL [Bartonella melophagi]|uniref:P-type conjugative transfer protein TrbL n=1 Tax=Bartonella melophagi TaxID=291176 RepID=UPI00031163EC|nr:P-type conjugative transfer protein TrbL [Bartonella melophagi]